LKVQHQPSSPQDAGGNGWTQQGPSQQIQTVRGVPMPRRRQRKGNKPRIGQGPAARKRSTTPARKVGGLVGRSRGARTQHRAPERLKQIENQREGRKIPICEAIINNRRGEGEHSAREGMEHETRHTVRARDTPYAGALGRAPTELYTGEEHLPEWSWDRSAPSETEG